MHVRVYSLDSKLLFRSLLEGLGFTEDDLPAQMDSDKWVGTSVIKSRNIQLQISVVLKFNTKKIFFVVIVKFVKISDHKIWRYNNKRMQSMLGEGHMQLQNPVLIDNN